MTARPLSNVSAQSEGMDSDYVQMESQWCHKLEEVNKENIQLRLSIEELEREKGTLQECLEKAEHQMKVHEAERDQAIKMQKNCERQLKKISEAHMLEVCELQERISFLETKLESVEFGKDLRERIYYLEQELVHRETEAKFLQQNRAQRSTGDEPSNFTEGKSQEIKVHRLLLEKQELETSLADIRRNSVSKDREISHLSRSLEEMGTELELMKTLLHSPSPGAKPEPDTQNKQGNFRKGITKHLGWRTDRKGGEGRARRAATLQLSSSIDSQTATRDMSKMDRKAGIRHAQSVDALNFQPRPASLKIRWKKKSHAKAPTNRIVRGAAVVNQGVVYFSSYLNADIWGYNSVQNQWFSLAKCPNILFAHAMVNGYLTAIGGQRSHGSTEPTNELLSLISVEGVEHEMWVELNSPMPTKRTNATAVTTDHVLVVAGGANTKKLDVVEIMNLTNKQWSVATRLPRPVESLSSAYCSATDRIFLMGGDEDGGKAMKDVLSCSVRELLRSCDRFNRINNSSEVWETLSELSVSHPTCLVVQEHLLALGGIEDKQQTDSRAVYDYDFKSRSWNPVVMMPSPAHKVQAAVLPNNRLMVVGGFTKVNISDNVYFAGIILE